MDKESTEEEQHLVEMFQCTKEQYDNRDELEPKALNSEKKAD
jgi:hypothetical protein